MACCPAIDPDGPNRFRQFHDEDLTGYEEGLWNLFLEDSGLVALADAPTLAPDARLVHLPACLWVEGPVFPLERGGATRA